MTPEDINIIVEAQGAETRQLVASLISDKLYESGFINIDVGLASRDDSTSNVVDGKDLPSLLDEMRALNPKVFERPVNILAMPFSTPFEVTPTAVKLMKDTEDLQPGQGRLEDGTIIDLATYVAPNGVMLSEALIEAGVAEPV